ncbi:leucine-rich repeat-containing protein [Heterostelium album PN500]|uniref:non-specific serine/threonine protein kinase n=1 Tax=Heterostelium pallidum (strain ATCC 26659 / Pp 5 / PN500) TaxID=670386 RepID=D3BJD3_HETP5|nr:leucine-rich repeat-containing protein [Heterostelium album PN500]EFA78013.1 leucine-rich repeat-containing protein [Heterostelium album PN500]|eukprot:XP_020430141.1 leucine-rich repeat-containing protein [Heterostelium album PN500]
MFADLSALGAFFIPESIHLEMSSLVELTLAHNNLSTIPNLSGLSSLEKLGLQGNRLMAISQEEIVLNLPISLKELNLASNQLTDLPTSIVKLSNLNTLCISNNNFKTLPSVLLDSKYESLTSLNISSCRYLEVFHIPTALVSLTTFIATGLERIAVLPEEIGRLSTLECLDLSENDFTTDGRLPWSITQLVNLKELSLNHSKLANFPLQILNLVNLRKLSLSNNLFTKLPNDISPLHNLVELNLSNNRLENVPSSIGQLEKLQVLSIQHNQIKELKPSMGLLPLEHLAIQGNPLRTPPPEIIAKGTVSILKFLKDLTKGQEECYRMKLMVVGQENVGKTTLIKVLRDKKKIKTLLAQPNVSTDGIIIDDWVLSGGQVKTKSKTVDNITLTTMDFAGQEVYYTTHQFFLSERSIYIIVWNTLKDEEHSRVEFWLQSITTRAPNSAIIIVGTHLDDLPSQSSAKTIKKQMEEKYCKRFPNIKEIKLVSCTSGKGLTSLRETIEQIASAQPNMGEILPSSYLLLENLVKEERRVRTIPTMSWAEFVQLGKLCTINDEDELVRATIFLNQIGSLVYFPNEEGLKKIVILDPQWITLMLASIITVKHNYTNQGVILHRDLKHIWKAPFYPQELHPHLLTLLEKFEISFNFQGKTSSGQLQDVVHDDNARSLIPALLSNECPSEFGKLWGSNRGGVMAAIQYGRQYQFDFIPTGLFSRLMVRILNFASSEAICYWRNGIILQREGEQVLVELAENLRILRFTIRGAGKQSVALLSRDVIETIQSLLQDSFKLQAKAITVPCVHCVEMGNEEDPFLFTLQQCENAVLNNIPYLMCRDTVNVRTDNLVPDLSMATFSGTRITKEQLQFQKLIGEGGSALVYMGMYKGKTVAIKKLKVGGASEDEDAGQDSEFLLSKAFTEFRRECWILSGLDHHENIVGLLGLCLNPLAIVTEFLPDGNLHGYLNKQSGKRLPWKLAIELSLDIALGMEYLHSSSPPILHRDLKSPNILMTTDKEKGRILAKVADFGLSGLQHTIIERCVVNPVWLAPEIMSGGEATTKSDIYSFGVILWEILTCSEFFGEISFMSVLEDMVIAGKRPAIPDWCHPTFTKLIEDCWNNDPKKRPPFTAIVSTLKQLQSSVIDK